ncbi:nitrous oxide reductase accessory protein NosL [Lysinibacillus sp. Y5S-8]|uniref:nitrous oxide reductase accessory protein NosL n=1 Tax=Lysinibacillus sp. Y5S-8 TaxID=3122488 RepID=UPI0030CBBCE0
MTRWITIFILCSALLVGCSDKTYKPREIISETDVCKICNMSIVHNEYAGQIVLKNGDYEIFDDIGCLMEYLELNGEDEVGAAYIKNKANNEWIDIYKATFVYNKEYWTPMNYGVLAFATKDEAQKWMTNEGDGQLLAYQDLLTFNWGIHE